MSIDFWMCKEQSVLNLLPTKYPPIPVVSSACLLYSIKCTSEGYIIECTSLEFFWANTIEPNWIDIGINENVAPATFYPRCFIIPRHTYKTFYFDKYFVSINNEITTRERGLNFVKHGLSLLGAGATAGVIFSETESVMILSLAFLRNFLLVM